MLYYLIHNKNEPIKNAELLKAFYEYKFNKSVVLSRCLEVIRAVFLEDS
jgi:hypothetical protein